MKTEKLVLLGAGNLAVHLGKALYGAGYSIVQVYSRTMESATALACELNAEPVNDISAVDTSATILIFALNENVMNEVLDNLTLSGSPLLIHTSGSISIDFFKERTSNYGVLYPLQTFSKMRPVNFSDIPVFTEANTKENLSKITCLARDITQKVHFADSAQRLTLHLTGIFMNNFVNYFYTTGMRITKEFGCPFDFEVFKPLILETALKAIESGHPEICQTGPAFRNNKEIISKHRDMLHNNPEIQNLYTFVSNNIGMFYNKENII